MAGPGARGGAETGPRRDGCIRSDDSLRQAGIKSATQIFHEPRRGPFGGPPPRTQRRGGGGIYIKKGPMSRLSRCARSRSSRGRHRVLEAYARPTTTAPPCGSLAGGRQRPVRMDMAPANALEEGNGHRFRRPQARTCPTNRRFRRQDRHGTTTGITQSVMADAPGPDRTKAPSGAVAYVCGRGRNCDGSFVLHDHARRAQWTPRGTDATRLSLQNHKFRLPAGLRLARAGRPCLWGDGGEPAVNPRRKTRVKITRRS